MQLYLKTLIFLCLFWVGLISPFSIYGDESEEFGSYSIEKNPRRPIIKLSDIGFSGPMVARGPNPQISFQVRRYAGMKNQLRAHLYLTLSSDLTPESRLSVFLNGIEVHTLSLEKEGRHVEFSLELDIKEDSPINIQISGNFKTIDNVITPWMMVLPGSQFQYELDMAKLPFFSEFITRNQSTVPVVLQNASQKNMQAALRMASVVGSLYIPWKLEAKLEEPSNVLLPHKIVIGDFESDIELKEKTIFVTPNGVNLFLQPTQNWIALLQSQEKVNLPHLSGMDTHVEPPRIFPFSSIHFSQEMMRGMGDLTTAIPFTLADFGQDCSKIKCYVVLSTTGTAEHLETFLSAKINGQLIQSIRVEPASERDLYTFVIPGALIESENFLELILMSYPASQTKLIENPPNETIAFTIHPDSYLRIYPGETDQRLTLSDFPGRFVGAGLFRFSSLEPNFCRMGFEAAQKIGKNQGRPSNISLQVNEGSGHFDQKYLVGILTPKDTATYNLPLAPDKEIFLFKPKTGQLFLEANKNNPFAILATLRIKTCPALFATDMHVPIFGNIHLPKTAQFEKMTTNIAFNIHNVWSPIILSNEMRVYYEDPRTFNQFWGKYKAYVVSFLAVLAAFFIYFTYTRLTKGEPD